MGKKLIKTIFFYSDGSFKEEKADNTDTSNFYDESGEAFNDLLDVIFGEIDASRRIQFNTAVFVITRAIFYEHPREAINIAINLAAEHQDVTNQTVTDKLYRQLDLTSTEYKTLVYDAIKNKSPKFKELLIKYAGKNSVDADVSMVEHYISMEAQHLM